MSGLLFSRAHKDPELGPSQEGSPTKGGAPFCYREGIWKLDTVRVKGVCEKPLLLSQVGPSTRGPRVRVDPRRGYGEAGRRGTARNTQPACTTMHAHSRTARQQSDRATETITQEEAPVQRPHSAHKPAQAAQRCRALREPPAKACRRVMSGTVCSTRARRCLRTVQGGRRPHVRGRQSAALGPGIAWRGASFPDV